LTGSNTWYYLAVTYKEKGNIEQACETLEDMQKFFLPEFRVEMLMEELGCDHNIN